MTETAKPKRKIGCWGVALGLLGACCLFSFALGAIRTIGQQMGLLPTDTPRPAAASTPAPSPTPAEVLTITEATEREGVAVRVQGAGLSAVRVSVERSIPVSMQITIPIGTFFVNRGDAQDMVAVEEKILYLTDQEEATALVAAACANLFRPIPDDTSTFDIISAPEQEELQRLIARVWTTEPSSVVRQVAVWIVTDDVTRSELDGRYVRRSSLFPLGGSPAASDEDVIYAIILVGESGIALTEKRIFTEKVSLVRALSSDNAMVRSYAMETLGVQSDRLLSYLVQVLQTGTAEIRRAAVYALGRLGDREAVEHIISALDDEEARVRREAVHSLEQLEAVEGLIGALTNPDAQVRNAAVYALRDLGDPKAVEPLSGLLSDPEAYIRQSVGFALGDLGDPRAVPALIEALGDPDRYVRGAAVRALGKIGDARAIDPLKALLDSEPDEEVRQDIERSLERLQR